LEKKQMKSKAVIGAKGTMAFAAVLVSTMLFSGYWSISSIRGLSDRFDIAVEKTARKMELGGRLGTIKSDMYVSQRGTLLAAFIKDPARISSSRQEFENRASLMRSTLDEARPLMSNPEGKRLLAIIEANFTAWLPEYREVQRLVDMGDPLVAQTYSFSKITPLYTDLGRASTDFVEVYKRSLESERLAAGEEYSASLRIAIGLICLSLLCIGVGGYIAGRIYRSIKLAASGIAEGAEQIASASAQVSGSSQSLAQGASQQAASLQETSSSSEEMASMTRKNAENSQQAAQFMNAVNQRVIEANRTLADMMTSMREIGASSGKISKIIRVIDEIAFQTNILALNAAVEAARAGEAGMGFAVVADEVRNLAQRSAQAAKDTAALIEESILKSGDGSTKLDEVAASIQAITEGAGKVKTLVDEVEASSNEQAQGIEQISKAVSQMDQVTQRTAASAEESASASEELNAQSRALMTFVGQLRAIVGGGSIGAGSIAKPGSRPPAARNNRRPMTAAGSSKAAAPALVNTRGPAGFPLDDSEFREF
jgi:methyl-accepting chemotaxis protein/methyl-accepting chemotaxis protein-1 (serine sensor receptor)